MFSCTQSNRDIESFGDRNKEPREREKIIEKEKIYDTANRKNLVMTVNVIKG
jgi:hypothetical protein